MKKTVWAFILCAALLCGCSGNGEDGISETAAPVTSSADVTTETSAKAETAASTAAVTEPAEIKMVLKPISSDAPFEVMACSITDNIAIESEEDFPNKEAIDLARKICFADEKIYRVITEENNVFADEEYGENATEYKIETAEDIPFMCGLEYDFDGDGEYEYVISLDYYPSHSVFDGGFVIYFDGDKYEIIINDGNTVYVSDNSKIIVISCENIDCRFLMLTSSAGAAWYSEDIYSFKNGMPEKVTNCDDAHFISYENGAFYINTKFMGTYPFVLCGDGVFRQFGREKISREDFEKHVQNGGEYLDSLAENGEEITEIYTYGYYNYELYGADFCYDVRYYNGFIMERYGSDGVGEEVRFTDEVVYGDVWAVQTTRSPNYDIGGGYVCFTTGKAENKMLNVAKDNIITDSIKLIGTFDPNWQIHFYDMDVPPCFALEAKGINYRTYFVIDGKITEMNWTLDGERLDTVDYTMIHCRGDGDGFVS